MLWAVMVTTALLCCSVLQVLGDKTCLWSFVLPLNRILHNQYHLYSRAKIPGQLVEWFAAAGFVLKDYDEAARLHANQPTCDPLRIADALQLLDPHRFPSASSAKKSVRKGKVLVNGEPSKIEAQVVIGVDRIQLHERAPRDFSPTFDPPFHVRVLFEDDWMAAVHKPPGVSTQPPLALLEPHLEIAASMRCAVPYFLSASPRQDLFPPRICHRLDKLTEGILLVAKTKSACTGIMGQFKSHSLRKRYLAVVHGTPPSTSGTVDLEVDGKEAVTDWRVRAVSVSPRLGRVATLELAPRHGRLHQIREHCARGLGVPIVGDPLFRPRPPAALHSERGLLLAAVGLDIQHPVTGAPLRFNIDPPARFDLNATLGTEQTRAGAGVNLNLAAVTSTEERPADTDE